ncbi:MAG: AmmeMemoRadiSam system protein B [Deltaproteobacteria bacterium]|nr:AmmeMemoRadiSam system protein B [Deltaproteobacteria bacterium]
MRRPSSFALLVATVLAAGCPSQAAEKAAAKTWSGPAPAVVERKVFGPIKAGSWYPGSADELNAMLDGFMAKAQPQAPAGRVVALVSPHAGYQWSGPTAAHGYALLKGQAYQRVIVMAPSHSTGFGGFCVLDAEAYRTPLGEIPIDTAATASLRRAADHRDPPRVWADEHAVEMQLPFLQRVLKPGFRLVAMLVGGNSSDDQLQRLADALAALADSQTLVVVSSDFTHYGANFGYLPFTDNVAKRLRSDLAVPATDAIVRLDLAAFEAHLKKTDDTICGREPIKVLLRMKPNATAKLLALQTSGDQTGDYRSSVSYAAIAFVDEKNAARAFAAGAGGDLAPSSKPVFRPSDSGLTSDEKKALLSIARASLTDHLTKDGSLKKLGSTLKLTPGLLLERGAFVTINLKTKNREGVPELRGCIGHMTPTARLHEQIAGLAIDAGTRDPRFSPMTAAELKNVDFEISILSPMQPVNSYRDIVIGKHGMTLEKSGRHAVFLPQVAPEWGWDLPTTLTHLARKAGLAGDAWQEGARFQVFTADVFGEAE